MKRFPTFNLYRTVSLSICTLIIINSFVLGLVFSSTVFTDVQMITLMMTRVATFFYIYLIGATIAFVLLNISEIIKIFLSIEDHLYSIRFAGTMSIDAPQVYELPQSPAADAIRLDELRWVSQET